jgi:FixJ family two-component response regulator
MGGAELAEKLRSRRAGLRVIFMTGYSEFSGKIDEKMTGEARMLQKPFSRSTLLEKVREILSAAPSKQTSGTKL